MRNDSSNEITVIRPSFCFDYLLDNRFNGFHNFSGRSWLDNLSDNRSGFGSWSSLNDWDSTNLHKISLGFTFFPIAVFVSNVVDGDQGTIWINIAVFTGYNVVLSSFLVSDVCLGSVIRHLVGIIVFWIGLEQKRIFSFKSIFLTYLVSAIHV